MENMDTDDDKKDLDNKSIVPSGSVDSKTKSFKSKKKKKSVVQVGDNELNDMIVDDTISTTCNYEKMNESEENWESENETEEEEVEHDKKKDVYLPHKPLRHNEELVCDESAYIMLREVQTGKYYFFS